MSTDSYGDRDNYEELDTGIDKDTTENITGVSHEPTNKETDSVERLDQGEKCDNSQETRPKARSMSECPVSNPQREFLHRLGKSDPWIDKHVHTMQEAMDATEQILAERYAAHVRHEAKPLCSETTIDLAFVRPDYTLEWEPYEIDDDGPADYDYDGWVTRMGSDTHNATCRGPGFCGFKWPEHDRYQPIDEYDRMVLRGLGKSDAWIDAHIHDRLVARAAIFELKRATEWETDNVTWMFREVPESAVVSYLVGQATPTRRLMQRVLQLPPLRTRWFEELGIQGMISSDKWDALQRQWGSDWLTVQDQHLARVASRTRYDALISGRVMRVGEDRHPYARDWNDGRGRLKYTNEPLGWVDVRAPDTINLRCDQKLFFDFTDPSSGEDPHYRAIVDDLNPRHYGEPNFGLENWVQAVVIRECRRVWQLRHWSPTMVEDQDAAEQDAYDYMRWFLYFVHDRRGACDTRLVPFTMDDAIKEVPDWVG